MINDIRLKTGAITEIITENRNPIRKKYGSRLMRSATFLFLKNPNIKDKKNGNKIRKKLIDKIFRINIE